MKTKKLPKIAQDLYARMSAEGYGKEPIDTARWIINHFQNYCVAHGMDEAGIPEAVREEDAFRIAMQMYYCCGFRRSEVQRLLISNINLETGKIAIIEGKNNVSRIVVASDSLLSTLREYAIAYLQGFSNDDFFLYPGHKRKTVENKIYEKYRHLLTKIGITPRKDGGYPRIHDLRHTFCVRALEQMQEKGFDLYTTLPMLSAYLGHKSLTETEYYLRLLEDHFSGIISQVDDYSPGLYICDGTDSCPDDSDNQSNGKEDYYGC